MALLNHVLSAGFSALLAPLHTLPSFVGIALLSVVTGIVVLWVYKKTSDQEGLDQVKRRIHASVYEIRLFNDDLRSILRAQLEIVWHNLTYLKLSLKPMIWLLPPLVLIISQLHYFYGYRALRPGENALLKVKLTQGWSSSPSVGSAETTTRPPLQLELPGLLSADTEGVWTPSLNEEVWRLKAIRTGHDTIGVTFGGERYDKSVRVSDDIGQVAPVRPGSSLFAQLEFPSERPLPRNSPIAEISLTYPPAEVWCLGLRFTSVWAWMILYFVLTMVVAFALRGPMGVTI